MIIEDIVSQHAEEAAFLWLLRDYATRAPHYNLTDLADHEERVEAHLDGLRVAGEEAWPFCADGLKQEDVGEVFAAGFIALDVGNGDWLAQVLETVDAAPETARGLVSALGWVDRDKLQGQVVEWLKSDNPVRRYLGVGACAVQRVDCGAYLTSAIFSDDPVVRARALRGGGEVRRTDLARLILRYLDDEDEACRFWAAWSATILGEDQGQNGLKNLVQTTETYREPAMQLAVRAMKTPAAIDWVRELNQQPELTRLVVQATGAIGNPVSIPWLIEKMEDLELARVAGEAFSMITGIDLAYDDLETDWPEGFEAGPTENPEDEDVAMDADEDLSWPAPELLSQWWSAHRHKYQPGGRYLCGKPISRESCLDVLRSGYQRQRRAAALELALLSPNAALFNVSARAKRQKKLLDH